MEEVRKNGKITDNPYQEKPGGQFKVGNPGRPVGARGFTSKVKDALEKIADGKEYTYEEAFIKAILKKAIIDQDTGMMKTVWEQLDGKPLQRIGNADGTNIQPISILGGKTNEPISSDTSDTQNTETEQKA